MHQYLMADTSKKTIIIIFKDEQTGVYDARELRILFDLFKGMSEACPSSSEPIKFTEFTKIEFDRVMEFTHEKCKDCSRQMPPEIKHLIDFLGLRFSLSTRVTFADHAVTNGDLDLLKWVHENGCKLDRWMSIEAAAHGHLDCLMYLYEHGCRLDSLTCSNAAENGHLDCLVYAHENECPWDEWACRLAAANGHLNCLVYAHENGCPWDAWTCLEAAKYGHTDCLLYARSHDCPE